MTSCEHGEVCGPTADNNAEDNNCYGPLVSVLPDASFHSSSQSSAENAPHFAKLNRQEGAGGWAPMPTDKEPWLQLDLRDRMEVTVVATQGRYDSSDWVSGYMLLYSDTGRAWKQYRQKEGVRRVGLFGVNKPVHVYLSEAKSRQALLLLLLLLLQRVGLFGAQCGPMSELSSVRGLCIRKEGKLSKSKSKKRKSLLGKTKYSLFIDMPAAQCGPMSELSSVRGLCMFLRRTWGSRVTLDLSFGGIHLPGKHGTFLRKNFHGCIENLYYNGINIIDLAKRRKPQITACVWSCRQEVALANAAVATLSRGEALSIHFDTI
ncbi:hypothetical protein CRUP_034178 [Coryphaenoides rupestris]|nr:hypothetical protein CRUP_034178 [Coryphaenoides rupestris]